MNKALQLRVGGVPEHFNLPWYRYVENHSLHPSLCTLEWKSFPEGTGAMCEALEKKEIDIAILLTDGIVSSIVNGHPAKIMGTYVKSPLLWGIHVHASSPYQETSDLAGKPFAISRYGSGSHLMTFILAHQHRWQKETFPEFVPVGTLEGARESLQSGTSQGFLWERTMTEPLIRSKEWRQIGVCPSPWPAFLIAAHPEWIEKHSSTIKEVLHGVRKECIRMKANRSQTLHSLEDRFQLSTQKAEAWLDETQWACSTEVDIEALEKSLSVLSEVGVISKEHIQIRTIKEWAAFCTWFV